MTETTQETEMVTSDPDNRGPSYRGRRGHDLYKDVDCSGPDQQAGRYTKMYVGYPGGYGTALEKKNRTEGTVTEARGREGQHGKGRQLGSSQTFTFNWSYSTNHIPSQLASTMKRSGRLISPSTSSITPPDFECAFFRVANDRISSCNFCDEYSKSCL